MDTGRRAFLRGHCPHRIAVPLRPPWAVREAVFPQVCDRCGDCIAACPTGVLVRGGGGFPEADFALGHCTFCADCAHACTTAARRKTGPRRRPALDFSPILPPWPLQAEIGAACLPRRGVLCRVCDERCEAGAIRFSPKAGSPAQPVVAADLCTGCGECVAACPPQALSMKPCAPPPSPFAT